MWHSLGLDLRPISLHSHRIFSPLRTALPRHGLKVLHNRARGDRSTPRVHALGAARARRPRSNKYPRAHSEHSCFNSGTKRATYAQKANDVRAKARKGEGGWVLFSSYAARRTACWGFLRAVLLGGRQLSSAFIAPAGYESRAIQF